MKIELVVKQAADNLIAQKMLATNALVTIPTNPADIQLSTSAALTAGTDATRGTPFLMIMSGTMPADVNTLTTLSAGWNNQTRYALVNWGNSGVADGIIAKSSANTLTFESPFKAADFSGAATWFWIGIKKYSSDFNFAPVYHSIIGSIGEFGSGADLECQSTSVIQGNNYRVANLKITFPMVLEY